MDLKSQFQTAKERLSAAAARLLAGDRSAVVEADQAMGEVERLRAGNSMLEANRIRDSDSDGAPTNV